MFKLRYTKNAGKNAASALQRQCSKVIAFDYHCVQIVIQSISTFLLHNFGES